MEYTKRKKAGLSEYLAQIHRQVFLRTVGSWGPVVVDKNGNIVEESASTIDVGAQVSPPKE